MDFFKYASETSTHIIPNRILLGEKTAGPHFYIQRYGDSCPGARWSTQQAGGLNPAIPTGAWAFWGSLWCVLQTPWLLLGAGFPNSTVLPGPTFLSLCSLQCTSCLSSQRSPPGRVGLSTEGLGTTVRPQLCWCQRYCPVGASITCRATCRSSPEGNLT